MRSIILLFFAGLVALSSCVPNRKILYLQKNDLDSKNAGDTAVRTYALEDFDYKVQTNDIISVRYTTLTQEEFDITSQQGSPASSGSSVGGALLRGELVDSHGEIPMPVVGKVKVAGLSVFKVQDTLQQLANRFLESTIVKVRLLNYRATILGEVNQEGTITFQNNRVSLMEAIGLAGGLGELADRSNVKIVRQVDSKTEIFYVNLLKEDFIRSPYYYVHQNDLIIVPPLRQRPFRKYFTQNVSIFLSAASIVLFVIAFNRR